MMIVKVLGFFSEKDRNLSPTSKKKKSGKPHVSDFTLGPAYTRKNTNGPRDTLN